MEIRPGDNKESPNTSLHPDAALRELRSFGIDRARNISDRVCLRKELSLIIARARDARLRWDEIAEAVGVSRSYMMRVWKESNGEKS